MSTNRQREARPTHTFTLVLAGVRELTDALEDTLFEAGCDDALLGTRDGVVYLDFDREAPSFREALLSAIAEVETAGFKVARVEPDELVTAAEIAQRTGRSRENIRQFILGTRGPGEFPPPVARLRGRSPLWRWAEVAEWFREKKQIQDPTTLLSRDVYTIIASLNNVLDLLRHGQSATTVSKLVRMLTSHRRKGSEGEVRRTRELVAD